MSYTDAKCKEFIYEMASGRIGMQWDPAGDPEGPNGDGTGLPKVLPPDGTIDIEFDAVGEPVNYSSSNQANFDSMIRRTSDLIISIDEEYQEKLAAYGTLVSAMQTLIPQPLPTVDADMAAYCQQFATVP